MKKIMYLFLMASTIFATSCTDDDSTDQPPGVFEGESKTYQLQSRSDASVSGTATVVENEDGTATVNLKLSGTSAGSFPAHVHANSAAETGDIIIDLNAVDGASGESTTIVTATKNGTAITYEQLLELDAYINVHQSATDLGTLIAQGDIGVNELTADSREYELSSAADANISGTATIYKRVSGASLLEIALEGTPADGEHPAHIHLNSAAEGGDIAISLSPVIGATGKSYTHIEEDDAGTALNYEALLEMDGYINVHRSATELDVLVAQGDIGVNVLTGDSKEFALHSVLVPTISGTAIVHKRLSGASLLELQLEGTPSDGEHPAHIHANTAAEGGDIAISLNAVAGASGKSWTHIEADDAGTAVSYEDLLEFDGYINVHKSIAELDVLVAQGDIGQNELTGNEVSYDLAAVSNAAIFGTATFSERVNKETLVTLELVGTTAGAIHPAHIHSGAVADAPGAVIVTLGNVIGDNGISVTNVTQANAGGALDYDALLAIDGYINVHLSAEDLDTLVAQGNVGANVN
ncbi:CHRD domain-containing protein [Arenibacter sp. BSSL-BM3]|uniref:CHRD domain-containing protein n=1 Tax=Arenibacter arenosicollis TaxID=2762274 RepID=A0ABR7QM33_9FLAO|nr:CHRD domain-containing protein [Arenibacter arenosicollis]MBC8768241.1 CHRD domain-containing protein [Arenibacter arenosicollis]